MSVFVPGSLRASIKIATLVRIIYMKMFCSIYQFNPFLVISSPLHFYLSFSPDPLGGESPPSVRSSGGESSVEGATGGEGTYNVVVVEI